MSPRTRTAGWGFADQVVASASNLALGLAAARALDATSLGAFAIVFSVYLLALNLGRAAIAQPLVARHSHVAPADWRASTSAAAGTAVAGASLAGVVLVVVAIVVSGDLGMGLAALAGCLPGLLLQDALRYALVADGRPRATFATDAAWAAMALPLLAAMALSPPVPAYLLVGAWGLTGAIAGVGAAAILRLRPRPTLAPTWIRAHRDLLPALVGSSMLEVGAQTLTTAGIAAIAGLPAAGVIRVGQLLLSPAFLAYQAVALVIPPEAARLARTAPGRLAGLLARAWLALAGVIALTVAAVWFLPDAWGRALLESNWDAGHLLVPQLGIAMAGQVAAFTAGTSLLVLTAMHRVFRIGILTATALTATQLAGAALAGATGVAWALAVTYPALGLVGWILARVTIDEAHRGVRPAPAAAG